MFVHTNDKTDAEICLGKELKAGLMQQLGKLGSHLEKKGGE